MSVRRVIVMAGLVLVALAVAAPEAVALPSLQFSPEDPLGALGL